MIIIGAFIMQAMHYFNKHRKLDSICLKKSPMSYLKFQRV